MRFVAAFLYAVAVAALVAVALAFAQGGLHPSAAYLALGLGTAVGGSSLWPSRRQPVPSAVVGAWEWAAVVAFALCSLRAFLWVVFLSEDKVRILSRNNLGDLPLHLTYVREMANGVPFWPENPILYGASLTYPLGVDLFHSLLTLAGLDLWRSFVWMGLVGAALTGAALWRWGRGLALLGFLGNGGLLGFELLRTGVLDDYQAPHGWKSIFLALFVTQRGLLFALPAGLLLLAAWRRRLGGETPGDTPPVLPWWGEVLLYAALPLFHLHTFLALSFFLFAWVCLQPARWRALAPLVAVAFLPATVLVLLVTDRLQGPSLLGWHPGWMVDDPDYLAWGEAHLPWAAPFLRTALFWPLNFGVLPLALGWLAWTGWKDAWVRACLLPAVTLFLLCCFVRFAVWPWDNTKLMIWSYLLVLPALGTHLLTRWPRWARAGAVALLFGSGVISTLGGLTGTGLEIASRHELEAVEKAVRPLPATTRFLAYPTYNHPLLLLGRPLALGYIGHVSSHGYAYEVPLARVEHVLRGLPGWQEQAAATGCRYLFWGREERAAYPDSTEPWRETSRQVASGSWGELYDLAAPAEAAQNSGPP